MAQPEPLPYGLPMPPPSPAGFEDFVRDHYRGLVAAAQMAGATREEAEDAASKALIEMLPKWLTIKYPLGYARKATVNNSVKQRQRDRRLAGHLIESGYVLHAEGADDTQLTDLEGQQEVDALLGRLTSAEREVMRCFLDGLAYQEIAVKLGKTAAAVRRNMCDARDHLIRLLDLDHPCRQQERSTQCPSGEEEAR